MWFAAQPPVRVRPTGALEYLAHDPQFAGLQAAHGLFDQPSVTIGVTPTTQQAAPFPWAALGAVAALGATLVAVLRYRDDRRAR